MRKLLFICCAVLIYGCVNTNRQAQTATTRTTERVGIEQGKPTQVTETTIERATTDEKTQAGIDVSKAIQAGFAAIKGDIPGMINAAMQGMVPAEPKGFDATTGGLAAGVVSAGLIAFQQFMARRKADRDAEEEWKLRNEAHVREVELARQLPPKQAEA